MSATVNKWLNNLPCTRFVRQVSNGTARSKYSFVAMMRSNAAALDVAPWKEAQCLLGAVTNTVNKVTQTDGTRDESGAIISEPSYAAYLDDRYDAFQQGGDADVTTARMCGYAGYVAYRFEVPSCVAEQSDNNFLPRLDLTVSRDRYLRCGFRVMVSVNSIDAPPDASTAAIFGGTAPGFSADYTTTLTAPDPAVEGVEAVGEFAQVDVGPLLNSRAGETTLSLDLSASTSQTVSAKYVWVFLALADYASYWSQYSANEPRYYSIEGSAMLVPAATRFGFADASTVADDPAFVGTYPAALSKPSLGENVSYATEYAYFGNLAAPCCVCGISVATEAGTNNRPALALINRAAPASRYDFPDGYFTPPTSLSNCLAHSDLRVFGNLPVGASNYNHIRGGFGLAVINRPCLVNADAVAQTDPVRAATYQQLVFSALPVFVPHSASSFSRMRLSVQDAIVRYLGFRPRILAWRSSSPDLFSGFGMAALGAATCNPDFVSGRSATITGSVTGDAEATEGVSLSVTCDRVASFDLGGLGDAHVENPPMSITVQLDSPVYPGEVVILVPSVTECSPFPQDADYSHAGCECFGAWEDVYDEQTHFEDIVTAGVSALPSYAFTPDVSFA